MAVTGKLGGMMSNIIKPNERIAAATAPSKSDDMSENFDQQKFIKRYLVDSFGKNTKFQ